MCFNSGSSNQNNYQKGDNVSLVSINNSDQEYFQNGTIQLYNIPSTQSIGDTCKVWINDSLQFNGYVQSVQQTIDKGVKFWSCQLVGKTYDLWRYYTDGDALYNGTTAYIASSLVSSYCTGVSGGGVTITDGVNLINDIDLTNMSVGDAIIRLSKLDGYKFYVDNNDDLQYYFPGVGSYDFTVEESDIIDMTPIEESDSDIINDVLVVGGSDYSKKTIVSPTHPHNTTFPNGILVSQRFEAEDPVLSAVKVFLNRSLDPNQPGTLPFEIWENTEQTPFDDGFDNWSYLSSGVATHYNVNISDSFLRLSASSQHTDCATEHNLFGLWESHKYWAQKFKPSTNGTLDYARVYCAHYAGSTYNFWLELVPSSATGLPDLSSIYTSSLTSVPTHFRTCVAIDQFKDKDTFVKINSGNTYFLVVREENTTGGIVRPYYCNANQPGGVAYPRGSGCYSDNGTAWTWITGDGNDLAFSVLNYIYHTSGQILSIFTTYDTQYMKLDVDGVVSSNHIYISGTNDSGTTWKTLSDGTWTDFGSESSTGTRVKYKFSSNGYYTPKIDSAELKISDNSGGFEDEIFNDSFTDYTYISSNSINKIKVNDGNLELSGGKDIQEYNQNLNGVDDLNYYYPSNVSFGNLGYIPSNPKYCIQDSNCVSITNTDTTFYQIFTMSHSSYIDKFEMYYHTSIGGGNCRIILNDIWISGTWTSGWLQVTSNLNSYTSYNVGYHTNQWNLSTDGYVYSGVKKIKIGWDGGGIGGSQTFSIYRDKFRLHDYFDTKGYVKSNVYNNGITNQCIMVEPTETNLSSYVTYSGSLDNGLNWTKLTKDSFTSVSPYGSDIILWYNLIPSGSWPAAKGSSSIMLPDTPRISDVKLTTSLVQGGGVPKSGTKIEWSDDISWTAGDIPYPSSYSPWQSYSTPKLSGLTVDDHYWMVFEYPSGSSKWWSYYYDSSSTYDGKICYSWDDGVNWSSNATQSADVPDGNMTFQLGWTQGDITATATNQTSIDSYGRHFKKISDSNYTTLEQAQSRADYEVSGMETIPMKGTLTIDGREDMSVNYRFSSNLDNFQINEIWEVVSYNQLIDKQGFRTIIEYGKHPFDFIQHISNLEKEVY